jgi:hypothetical protein
MFFLETGDRYDFANEGSDINEGLSFDCYTTAVDQSIFYFLRESKRICTVNVNSSMVIRYPAIRIL